MTHKVPPHFFQIDEIYQHSNSHHYSDCQGRWKPSTDPGANVSYTAGVGVTGKQWFCNGQQIYEVASRPSGAQLYKTFSVYYIEGAGFSILRGDARHPVNGESWHPLQFTYNDDGTYSSFLTNAGQGQTLCLQPRDSQWAHLILPTNNHTEEIAPDNSRGGVIGELPIFLALLASTTSRNYLPSVLPHTFSKEGWAPSHAWQMSRIHQRGVVVSVYTCPPTYPPNAPIDWTGSSPKELHYYELGSYGKYFY